MLDRLVTMAKKDHKKITKKEDKMNSQKIQEISVVKEVSSRREYLQSELTRLTQGNQEMILELDVVEKQIEVASEDMEMQINPESEKN